jgi:hypothetical protein
MATEYAQTSFFDKTTWSNSYYAALLPVEYFLSQVMLRGDASRVFWSSDDIAFRKRFQNATVENGADFDQIQPQTLNFPFANYWYSGGLWVPDDRAFAVNPIQMMRGLWDVGLPTYMRAMAVKTTLDATVYYDRDDDARMNYEAIMWEQQPKGPVQFTTSVSWQGVEIALPVFITIESIEYNPSFQEGDWLKQQRILPIKIKLAVRTYILFFPRQTNIDGNPRPFTPFGTGASTSPENDQIYITERVILDFATAKQWGTAGPVTASDYVGTAANSEPVGPNAVDLDVVNPIVTDIVQGYFQAATDITVNAVVVDPATITPTSFTLSWAVRAADLPNLTALKIQVPGQTPIIITDSTVTTQIVDGLFPNSTYEVTALFYSASGSITTFSLTTTTAADPTDLNPLKPKRRRGQLKGMTW